MDRNVLVPDDSHQLSIFMPSANMSTKLGLNTQASLENLPPELQTLIFELICPHCFFRTLKLPWSFDKDLTCRRKAIKALALTSKCLRRVALPFMLHEACDQLSAGGIFRLFDAQPELAAHMRHFDFNMGETDKSVPLELIEPSLRRAYGELVNGINFVEVKSDPWKAAIICSELFMSLATNLSSISVEVPERFQNVRSGWNCVPAPFPRLQFRYGKNKFKAAKSLRLVNPTGFFTNISHPFVNSILSHVPNLEHLSFHGLPGNSSTVYFNFANTAETFGNLRTMDFQGCAFGSTFRDTDFDVFSDMLLHASKLESFSFRPAKDAGGVIHAVPPTEFIAALKPHLSTLRVLSLNWREINIPGERNRVTLSDVAGFTNLRELELSQNLLCGRGRKGEDHDVDANCLAEVIPQTVEKMRVFLGLGDRLCHLGILSLSKKVGKRMFPNLESLEITKSSTCANYKKELCYHGQTESVVLEKCRQAFEGTGIKLQFSGNLFRWIKDLEGDSKDWMSIIME